MIALELVTRFAGVGHNIPVKVEWLSLGSESHLRDSQGDSNAIVRCLRGIRRDIRDDVTVTNSAVEILLELKI